MVEQDIRDGICYAINQYAKDNNKHMKDHDKNKESSYLKQFVWKGNVTEVFFRGF